MNMRKPSAFIISDLLSPELWGKHFDLKNQFYDSDYIVCDLRQAHTIVALGLGKKSILAVNQNIELIQGINELKQNVFPMFKLVLNINGITTSNFLNVSGTPITGDYDIYQKAKEEQKSRNKETQEKFLGRKFDYFINETLHIPYRTKMLEIISATGSTISYGNLPQTIQHSNPDKSFTRTSRIDARFGVTIEDSFFEQYVSSKLISMYARGLIPIYVGYAKSSEYLSSIGINPKAFVPITQPPLKEEDLNQYIGTVAPFFKQFMGQKPEVFKTFYSAPLLTEQFDVNVDKKFNQIIETL